MPGTKFALESLTIVLIGSFNPAIFHPHWFARHNVTLSEQAADTAEQVVTSSEVSTFVTERLNVHVLGDRFQAGTSHAPAFERVRDLAVDTFRVLSHTPIRMMGINRQVHFETKPDDLWHAVGHHMAPKDVWSEILEKPGMRSLTIEGARPDQYRGAVRVKIEPSTRVQPGVFLDINDHFEVSEEDAKAGQLGTQLIDALEQEWVRSYQRSTRIIEHVGDFIWSLRTKAS